MPLDNPVLKWLVALSERTVEIFRYGLLELDIVKVHRKPDIVDRCIRAEPEIPSSQLIGCRRKRLYRDILLPLG